MADTWIFSECIHCWHRKHLCEKQQGPLKESVVLQLVLGIISNHVGVIGKYVKKADDLSHNKNPKVQVILRW